MKTYSASFHSTGQDNTELDEFIAYCEKNEYHAAVFVSGDRTDEILAQYANDNRISFPWN